MKRFIILTVCILTVCILFGCHKSNVHKTNLVQITEEIYHLNNAGTLIISNDSITPRILPSLDLAKVTPYTPIDSVAFTLQGESYKVVLSRFKGWDNEPGVYDVFTIYCQNQKILEWKDYDSWIKTPDSLRELFAVPNEYFQIYSMDNGLNAIILEGYSYCNLPPMLTIIILKQGSAHVVYNSADKYLIRDVTVLPGGYFEIELHDAVPSGDPDYNPNVYYLKATPSGMGLYK